MYIQRECHSVLAKLTGDPLHSRAACTQPCNVNTHSHAHCSPGARLCEQWGHGCVNNGARLCASARLCRGSPVKLHPITFYRIVFLGTTRFLGWMPLFVFFGLPIVLLFDKSLILGCLWPLVFVLNNTLVLGIWCSTIPHLPGGCFCPWTFFDNIGFNTVLTDPFMSHLATQLEYSAGEFQALQLIVLAAFGVLD